MLIAKFGGNIAFFGCCMHFSRLTASLYIRKGTEHRCVTIRQMAQHQLKLSLMESSKLCCHQHSTPLLEKLHWLPISELIKYKVACRCTCFSAINGSGPAYLSELLHVYTPSCTLRASSDTCMVKIQQYKRKSHGFYAFSCFGPHIWNSLPQDLRRCSTLLSFKAKLKTFLFSQYFHTN